MGVIVQKISYILSSDNEIENQETNRERSIDNNLKNRTDKIRRNDGVDTVAKDTLNRKSIIMNTRDSAHIVKTKKKVTFQGIANSAANYKRKNKITPSNQELYKDTYPVSPKRRKDILDKNMDKISQKK